MTPGGRWINWLSGMVTSCPCWLAADDRNLKGELKTNEWNRTELCFCMAGLTDLQGKMGTNPSKRPYCGKSWKSAQGCPVDFGALAKALRAFRVHFPTAFASMALNCLGVPCLFHLQALQVRQPEAKSTGCTHECFRMHLKQKRQADGMCFPVRCLCLLTMLTTSSANNYRNEEERILLAIHSSFLDALYLAAWRCSSAPASAPAWATEGA